MKIFPLTTLRTHLVTLVIVSVVPMILFAGAMILASYRNQQAVIERGIRDTARALSAALDREFTGSIRALKVLASSKALANDRLPEFYEEMKEALAAYGPAWQNITLSDRTGQQLINLRRPFGSPLPRLDPELIERNLQTGEATISNLFSGPLTGVPSIVVSVLVLRDGQIKYLLRAGFSTARLSALLSQQDLPADWIATIIDRNQVIAARTRDLEKLLGKPASASLAAQARQHREASWRGATLEGIEVVSALRRSELSGWTVALGVPAAAVDTPVRNSLMLAGAVGLALLGASLYFAAIIGRRVARAADQLTEGARALGRGEIPRLKPAPIAEMNPIARELEGAAAKREQAEKARQESSEQLRAAFEQAGIGITVYELESRRFVRVNRQFCDILGYTQEECLQLRPADVNVPDEQETADAYSARLLRGELASYTREKRYVRKDGRIIWVRLSVSALRNPDGRPSHGLAIVEDITERQRAEEALHSSERSYANVVKNISGAVYRCRNDPDWTIEFISDGCLDVTGYRSEEFLWNRVTSLGAIMHPDDARPIREKCQTNLGERKACRNEYRIIHRSGEIRWVWDQAQGVYSDSGELLFIEGLLEDITERILAEQQLRELPRRLLDVQEAERRRISRELHDSIGQNLSALNLNLGIIGSQLPKGAPRELSARFDDARKLLETTSQQVRDVMADLRPPALDDYGLLAALRVYVEPYSRRVGIPVSVHGQDLAPRPPLATEMALFRIAQEALANAAKHARARKVEVTLGATPQNLSLTVADDGVGFDPQTVTWSRLHWGMTTMRERAEAIGAELRIESAPGMCTRVVVEVARSPT